MGEDLEAEGRMAVRTPMQWSHCATAGSPPPPARRLVQRLVPDGFGPEHVNVADQEARPRLARNFMRHLVQTYRECPELGWGDLLVLPQPHRQVFAHRCRWDGSSIVAVHNLGADLCDGPARARPFDTEGDAPVWLEDLLARVARAVTRRRLRAAAGRLRAPLVPGASRRQPRP